MKKKILLFAGTTEGRLLAETLFEEHAAFAVFVATEYGKQVLPEAVRPLVSVGRLDGAAMETLLMESECGLVLDATHPYAVEVTKNLRLACEKTGTRLVRVLRESADGKADKTAGKGAVRVLSAGAAAKFLKNTEGNILLTTGSKEISEFSELPDFKTRVYARVLPSAEAVSACGELGISGDHLFAMQGPFSAEMNLALLRQTGAKWLVTKESGKAGGFSEKLAAAAQAGAAVIVIERPGAAVGLTADSPVSTGSPADQDRLAAAGGPAESGVSVEEALRIARKLFPCPRTVTLIGAGPGDPGLLTREAAAALASCDLIAGAARMVEQMSEFGKPTLTQYRPEAILEYLKDHPKYRRIAVVLSGDTGFYSGARQLFDAFSKEPEGSVRVLPGISSVACFFSKIGGSWEDVRFLSLHGHEENIFCEVRENRRTFLILGSADAGKTLCRTLIAAGLFEVRLTFGENLSLPEEHIFSGTPSELKETLCAPLTVVLIENPGAGAAAVTHGLEDEEFLRGGVPMTKMEARSVSVSKLRLSREAVVYDVGAGTGSVAVECARICRNGTVYAIERDPEALALIRANREKFCLPNLLTAAGTAPDAFADLPAPTHVFVGGSGGKLEEILCAVLQKNPAARVVINAVSVETLAAATALLKRLPVTDAGIVQITAARDRLAGPYHLMTGQNPVSIISFTGIRPQTGLEADGHE